jgi:uncharacterized protein YjbJ (UPF0337 family)
MTSDRIEGKAKEAAGTVERTAGKMTGDERMEARGASREMEGKAQGLWGKLKSLFGR